MKEEEDFGGTLDKYNSILTDIESGFFFFFNISYFLKTSSYPPQKKSSVYFVDEDVFNFSLSKFSVKHTNTLLHLKTNFAQVPPFYFSKGNFSLLTHFFLQILHEWSVKREVSLSQFVVVSVFGADYNGSHTTPHSNSHYFYRHMVMR